MQPINSIEYSDKVYSLVASSYYKFKYSSCNKRKKFLHAYFQHNFLDCENKIKICS